MIIVILVLSISACSETEPTPVTSPEEEQLEEVIEYFSKYTNFENGLYRPGTNVKNVVNELKEKAGA